MFWKPYCTNLALLLLYLFLYFFLALLGMDCFIFIYRLFTLVYRNIIYFHILILYSAALLSLLNFNRGSVRAHTCILISYIQNHVVFRQGRFYVFLSNLDAFYFCDWTGWNPQCTEEKSWRSCIIFSPLSMMLAVGFSQMPFITLRKFSSLSICWEFLLWAGFCQMLSFIYWDGHVVFTL